MVSPKNSVTRKNVPRYYTLNGQVRYIYLTYKYGGLLKSKSKFKPALRNDLPIKKKYCIHISFWSWIHGERFSAS